MAYFITGEIWAGKKEFMEYSLHANTWHWSPDLICSWESKQVEYFSVHLTVSFNKNSV